MRCRRAECARPAAGRGRGAGRARGPRAAGRDRGGPGRRGLRRGAGRGFGGRSDREPRAPAASHWRSDLGEGGAGPALPAGCRPLAEVVKAPPALARRLAQIGVVEAAAADTLQPTLAQGQRLVSRDGGLWRWDGLVRRPEAKDGAAARLRQATRRRQLAALLADQHALLDGAGQAVRAAAAEAHAEAERRQRALEAQASARAASRNGARQCFRHASRRPRSRLS